MDRRNERKMETFKIRKEAKEIWNTEKSNWTLYLGRLKRKCEATK